MTDNYHQYVLQLVKAYDQLSTKVEELEEKVKQLEEQIKGSQGKKKCVILEMKPRK